ncbi:hypothetical protein L596_024208 [Steinernema carpocapsae]|uniref:Uncharacterized protein n=1 Tax=Steinernema carpocapsae TaxID=34508 RepID=A0A4U5MGB4_STECR|nr:hypothetical protein L596_024208 [Steinernema carpocapsae]
MSGIKRQSKTFPVCKATFAGKSRPDSPATTSRDFILGQHHCRQSVARIQSVNSFRNAASPDRQLLRLRDRSSVQAGGQQERSCRRCRRPSCCRSDSGHIHRLHLKP